MSTSYDFLEFYYPSISEVSPERIAAMRSAASTLIRSAHPEVDTGPNSVFGDLFVSPAAVGMASHEVAGNRLLSDMLAENIEQGTVWNCDFATRFLLNYGIQDDDIQRSYGIIRLAFEDDTPRELDRSTEFQVGDGIYRPYAPYAGPVELLAPGEVGDAGTNYVNYTFIGANSWAVDILVFGQAGQLAEAGSSLEIDRQIDGLVSGIALSDFLGGTSPSRIQELARRVRHNYHGRTPSTRSGATNLIHQHFPEITITGATVSGDYEQVRDTVNPGQIAGGYLDLMVRSVDLLEDTVTVRLRQMNGEGGALCYAGWLALPETPIRLTGFANGSNELSPQIYSVSTDSKAPGLTAAYGASERLFVAFYVTEDSSGNPSIRASLDEDGVYADFEVKYLFDPALKICQEFMRSDEHAPAGLSFYTRWFVPVEVDSMIVDFNRKAGMQLNLAAARKEILDSFNSHRFETPAGAALVDSAMYYAGAHSVNEISFDSYIRYSVADQVWTGTTFVEPTDQATWEAFIAECASVPVISINTVYSPDFTYYDDVTQAASGARNVSYLLASSNLKLVERRSV